MRDHDVAGNQMAMMEQFVELTTHVPSELQRLLATIRDLDEKTNSLASEVRQDVAVCLDLVPQSSWKSPNGEQYKEVAERRASIEERQRKLVQMSEEKVQVAVQGYELLDTMLGHLKEHLKEFEEEEEDDVAIAGGGTPRLDGQVPGILGSMAIPSATSGIPPLPRRPSAPQISRKGSEKKLTSEKKRERDTSAQEPASAPKAARRAASSSQLPSLASGLEGFFAGNPEKAKSAVAAAAAAVAAASGAAAAGAIEAAAAAAVAGAATPVSNPTAAAAAAIQQAAAAAAAPAPASPAAAAAVPNPAVPPQAPLAGAAAAANPTTPAVAAAAAAAAPGTAAPQQQQQQPPQQEGQQTPPQTGQQGGGAPLDRSAIKNLQPGAATCQAPGNLLTHADISQELRGRHAELFWPDDKMWYVITIDEVNPVAKTARIMYTTGETEELDLNEIVRDAHMSLISAKSK